jgi:hypothetical protein
VCILPRRGLVVREPRDSVALPIPQAAGSTGIIVIPVVIEKRWAGLTRCVVVNQILRRIRVAIKDVVVNGIICRVILNLKFPRPLAA